MKRGPLAWVHLVKNRFGISETKSGDFLVFPIYGMEKIGNELVKNRSTAIYWRDKFTEIFKAGFIAGMNYVSNIPDKNQTDLFKVAE